MLPGGGRSRTHFPLTGFRICSPSDEGAGSSVNRSMSCPHRHSNTGQSVAVALAGSNTGQSVAVAEIPRGPAFALRRSQGPPEGGLGQLGVERVRVCAQVLEDGGCEWLDQRQVRRHERREESWIRRRFGPQRVRLARLAVESECTAAEHPALDHVRLQIRRLRDAKVTLVDRAPPLRVESPLCLHAVPRKEGRDLVRRPRHEMVVHAVPDEHCKADGSERVAERLHESPPIVGTAVQKPHVHDCDRRVVRFKQVVSLLHEVVVGLRDTLKPPHDGILGADTVGCRAASGTRKEEGEHWLSGCARRAAAARLLPIGKRKCDRRVRAANADRRMADGR
eukprot:2513144-Prymnesium_polylepis.2